MSLRAPSEITAKGKDKERGVSVEQERQSRLNRVREREERRII